MNLCRTEFIDGIHKIHNSVNFGISVEPKINVKILKEIVNLY